MKNNMPLIGLSFFFFAMFISGCTSLETTSKIHRLQKYSHEKDAQHNQVQSQNKKFDLLLAAARSGSLNRNSDKKRVVRSYGEPVLAFALTKANTYYDVWLYRYATQYFGMDKVYLYFDEKGRLNHYEISPGH